MYRQVSLEESRVKYTKFNLPILLLSYAFLVACAQVKDILGLPGAKVVLSNQAKTFVYECPDGYSFTVSLDGGQAWLFLPEQTIQLPHVSSGSGAKFSKKQITFWSKGNEARLESGSKVHVACKNNQAKAVWEHAKLNGVDFRALGNEPSWVLEIVNGNTIIFSDFYDKINFYVFKKPEPEVDQSTSTTIFKVKNESHVISVSIFGTTCQDTMSGELFESSVIVELDGKSFKGCGKALH